MGDSVWCWRHICSSRWWWISSSTLVQRDWTKPFDQTSRFSYIATSASHSVQLAARHVTGCRVILRVKRNASNPSRSEETDATETQRPTIGLWGRLSSRCLPVSSRPRGSPPLVASIRFFSRRGWRLLGWQRWTSGTLVRMIRMIPSASALH